MRHVVTGAGHHRRHADHRRLDHLHNAQASAGRGGDRHRGVERGRTLRSAVEADRNRRERCLGSGMETLGRHRDGAGCAVQQSLGGGAGEHAAELTLAARAEDDQRCLLLLRDGLDGLGGRDVGDRVRRDRDVTGLGAGFGEPAFGLLLEVSAVLRAERSGWVVVVGVAQTSTSSAPAGPARRVASAMASLVRSHSSTPTMISGTMPPQGCWVSAADAMTGAARRHPAGAAQRLRSCPRAGGPPCA
jgi:hypothetical protein